MAFAEARRSRYFYAVSVAYLFLLGSQVGRSPISTAWRTCAPAPPRRRWRWPSWPARAPSGRLAGGWLLLKVPRAAFALVLMAMQAGRWRCWPSPPSRTSILAGAVLFGVTMGNSLMMHPLLLAERFGTRDYGRIYSTSQLVTMVGVAGCPPWSGSCTRRPGLIYTPCSSLAVSAC